MWEGRDAVVLILTLKTQLSGQYRYVFVGISVTVSASQVAHPPPHFCGGMLLVMMEPRHYGTPLLLLLLPWNYTDAFPGHTQSVSLVLFETFTLIR